MTALEWTIIWSVLVLAFNGGIAWGVVRTVGPKVEKLQSALEMMGDKLGEVATTLHGIEKETEARHEANQARLDHVEKLVDAIKISGKRRTGA